MSFWRKFGKGVFMLSLIVCIGLIVYVTLGQRYIGIMERTLILVGGIVLVLVVHTFLGMFIEMCDNIAEIKAKTGNNSVSQYKGTSYMNGSRVNDSER